MRNAKWADCFEPVDPNGHCFADLHYTKAYLHHLFKAKELLAMQIASIHNLAFYLWLVREARRHLCRLETRHAAARKPQTLTRLRATPPCAPRVVTAIIQTLPTHDTPNDITPFTPRHAGPAPCMAGTPWPWQG